MTNHKWSLRFALGVAALSLSFSTFAHGHHHDHCPKCPPPLIDDKAAEGFIVGLEAGYVINHWSDINQNAFRNNDIVVQKDWGAGGRIYVGYVTNKYIAYQLGYSYLGEATIQRWNGFGRENFPLTEIRNWALDASIRLSAPIYGNAGLFATFGAMYLASDKSVRWNANELQTPLAEPNFINTATYQAMYGFGAYKDITCNIRVEILWRHYEGQSTTDDLYQPSPDFYAVGFVYRI